jgi:tetratricopeptide (TPR) repeat protein
MIAKLGDVEERNRNIAGALARYQDALRIAEALARSDANNRQFRELTAALLNKAAFAQENLGDVKAAQESFRHALEIDEAGLQADPTNARARDSIVVAEKNLGDLYWYELNNKPEALTCYRRAADLLEAACRADPGNIAWRQRQSEILMDVASALLATGQKEEARRQAERGLAVAKDLADRPNATQEHVYNYAWLAVNADPDDLQDPKGALPYALKAVQMSGSSDEFSLHVLAQAYAGTGDYRRAVETEEKALALFPALPPGQPKPDRQRTMERAMARFREQLKKAGGAK